MTEQVERSDVERRLLGRILLNPELMRRQDVHMAGRLYKDERHRLIWSAMTRLQQQGRTLEVSAVEEMLRQMGVYERVGGLVYIAELTLVGAGERPEREVDEAVWRITGFIPASERIHGEAEARQELARRAIPYPMTFLADYLHGIFPSDFVVVSATEDRHASRLAHLIQAAAVDAGKHVYLASLDAEPAELDRRISALGSLADLIVVDDACERSQPSFDAHETVRRLVTIREAARLVNVPVVAAMSLDREEGQHAAVPVPELEDFHDLLAQKATALISLAQAGEENALYVTIPKSRMAGACRYVARVEYREDPGCYLPKYQLGRVPCGSGSFERLDGKNIPAWARHAVTGQTMIIADLVGELAVQLGIGGPTHEST